MVFQNFGTHGVIKSQNFHKIIGTMNGKKFAEKLNIIKFDFQQYFVYRTVALDIRGYGESDKPKGRSHYTIANVCADIKAVIEHLSIVASIFRRRHF